MITDDQLKEIFDSVGTGVNLTVTLDCCNSGGALDQVNQYQPLGPAAEERQLGGRYLPPPVTEEQTILNEEILGFKPRQLQRNVDATGLLISGSQAHQTSADAYIDGDYIGACTYYLVKNLQKNNWTVNYKSLVDGMNTDLAKAGYTQRPELNGSAKLFGNEFLKSTGSIVEDSPVEIVEGVAYIDLPTEDDKKGGNTMLIILSVVAIAAIAAITFGIFE